MIQELIDNVRQWGVDKEITGPNGKGTLLGQLNKSQEELTETRDAASIIVFLMHLERLGFTVDLRIAEQRLYFKDGIGDTTVTLILAAEMAGLRFEDCLQAAYDEIKGRKGKMVEGVFVKEVAP